MEYDPENSDWINPITGEVLTKYKMPSHLQSISVNNKAVRDGTMALDTWGRMVLDPNFNEDIEPTRKTF